MIDKFKVCVIEYMHANYLSLNETAALFGIPNEITLTKWARIYYEEGQEVLLVENRGRKKRTDKNKPTKPRLDNVVIENFYGILTVFTKI